MSLREKITICCHILETNYYLKEIILAIGLLIPMSLVANTIIRISVNTPGLSETTDKILYLIFYQSQSKHIEMDVFNGQLGFVFIKTSGVVK